MHLLFATSIIPDGTLGSGYEIANAAIIDALHRAGVRVTVLGFVWPGRKPADPDNAIVMGEVDVKTDGAPFLRKLQWLGKAVLTGMTFTSAKLTVVTRETLRNAIDKAGPFDAYVLNAATFAGAFDGLFDDRPTLYVAHNVEYRSAEENSAAARGALQRLIYRREARFLKALEERLCRKARFVFTLAEEDSKVLGVEGRSAVLPLVTRSTAPVVARPRAVEYDAALIGSWTWQPNRIGLDWFLDDVAPHLPADFTVRIAGTVPSGLTSDRPNIRFVGRVPSAEDFVLRAKVIPLTSRAGTGVQLKTIETFELGLPSVATTSSLRGIGYRPTNCIVADDPVEFAEALKRAATGAAEDIDGAQFHDRQRRALDAAIKCGLATVGYHENEAVA
jgi:hypothetical protein